MSSEEGNENVGNGHEIAPRLLYGEYKVEEEQKVVGPESRFLVRKMIDDGDESFVAKVIRLDEGERDLNDVKRIHGKFKDRQKDLFGLLVKGMVPVVAAGVELNSDKTTSYCAILGKARGDSLHERQRFQWRNKTLTNEIVPGNELKSLLLFLCDAVEKFHEAVHIGASPERRFFGSLNPFNIFLAPDDSVMIDLFDPWLFFEKKPGADLHGYHWTRLLWTAPETLHSEIETPQPFSDAWSIGVIMHQLMRGEYPFHGESYQEIESNILSSENNRRKITYLPPGMERLLERCLSKDPSSRFQSIAALAHAIKETDFSKECEMGHTNDYFERVCTRSGCTLGFEKTEEKIKWTLHKKWLKYSALPDNLGGGEERVLHLEIYPHMMEDFEKRREKGCEFSLNLQSSPEPFNIRLLPSPRFSVSPENLDIEFETASMSRPVQMELKLLRSEIIVEKIEAQLVDLPEAHIEVDFPELLRPINFDTAPIRFSLTVNTETMALNKNYDLILRLRLRNRSKPAILGGHTSGHNLKLRLVNPPKLHLVPEQGPILMTVNKVQGPIRQVLKAKNKGSGELEIMRIDFAASKSDAKLPELVEIIRLEKGQEQISVSDKFDQEIFFFVNPENIPTSDLYLRITCHYRYSQDGKWIEKEDIRDLFIEVLPLKQGRVLAIDFGTTNSLCAAVAEDISNPIVVNLSNSDHENAIPSVIRYYDEEKGIDIGDVANLRFREGNPNAKRSFKRRLADMETPYKFYPPKGGIDRRYGDELIGDYIRTLVAAAVDKLGYEFDSYIFTHPSKLTLPKLRAYREILEGLKMYGGYYSFIDEATAGALDFIANKEGRYRLMVYDFGGGTIDITYLLVRNQEGRIEVEIIDVGGIPDFGGDNVTLVIRDLVIDQILKADNNLLLPEEIRLLLPEKNRPKDFNDEKRAGENAQRLWGYAEELKKWVIFGKKDGRLVVPKETINEPTGVLYIFNQESGRIEEKSPGEIKFTLSDIYQKIFPKIVESVEICHSIFLADKDTTGRSTVDLPFHILLSGRSSAIPLVADVFECFKEGKKPVWDGKDTAVWQEKDKPEILRKDAVNVEPLLYDDDIIISESPKASVARGAARYWIHMQAGNNIKIKGLKDRNRSRFGLKVPTLKLGWKFEEWIPQNRKLVDTSTGNPEDPVVSEEMAIAEKDKYKFNFNVKGTLAIPVEVYEHHGRDNNIDGSSCSLIGKYDLRRPDFCSEDSVIGKLRIEVTKDLEVRVKAEMGGRWFDAFKC